MPLEFGHSLLVPSLLFETTSTEEIDHLSELLSPIVVDIDILLSNRLHHLHLGFILICWRLEFSLQATIRVDWCRWINPSNNR